MTYVKFPVKKELFEETTHSPALVDIVGPDLVKDVIDFCFVITSYSIHYTKLYEVFGTSILEKITAAGAAITEAVSKCFV